MSDSVLANPDAVSQQPSILTVAEAARELRCSKAHVHHLIAGKVQGVRPLPSLWLGRRRLILRASLQEWIRASEESPMSAMGAIQREPGDEP
jgi:excisionase family DNA binding protein